MLSFLLQIMLCLFGTVIRNQHTIKQHLYYVRATCLLSQEICFYLIMNIFKEISPISFPSFSHVTNDSHENVIVECKGLKKEH